MMQRLACRSCGAEGLDLVLSLGLQPLANALGTVDGPASERYPLDLVFCRACGLMQSAQTMSPDRLFSEYPYFSSVADTMVDHARQLVGRLIAERALTADDLVIEIGSNDGYLLQFYQARGIPVLGIEPSINLVEAARRSYGIASLPRFFDQDVAEELCKAGRRAAVIHAHNVFGHVPSPRAFAGAVARLLRPDGVAVIEVPYVKDLIDGVQFDTIYHEHFSYFSLTALEPIWAAAGLVLADVERIAIHGGSLRLLVVPAGRGTASPRVAALLAEEARWGALDAAFCAGFASEVAGLGAELRELLVGLKREGKRIAGYGASAKGSVLLNHFGIGHELIDFVADRAPAKQGRLIPGTHIPVVPPQALVERMPDYLLLLVRNIATEILAQQREYRKAGGRIIIPVPRIEIL
jgi:SAM-dependent methyltransferase